MDRPDREGRGFIAYALITLVLTAAATALTGGDRDLAFGFFAAWIVQLVAFRPLVAAVATGADATRPWLGGLVLRGAGLLATGGLALGGVMDRGLPIAYGTGMTGLLLVEAGWLFRRLPRPGTVRDGRPGGRLGTDNGIERTTG